MPEGLAIPNASGAKGMAGYEEVAREEAKSRGAFFVCSLSYVFCLRYPVSRLRLALYSFLATILYLSFVVGAWDRWHLGGASCIIKGGRHWLLYILGRLQLRQPRHYHFSQGRLKA